MIIDRKGLNKKNQLNGDIFKFHNCHKIFLYEKIKSLVIEKFEHDVKIIKTFIKI